MTVLNSLLPEVYGSNTIIVRLVAARLTTKSMGFLVTVGFFGMSADRTFLAGVFRIYGNCLYPC